MIKLKSLVEARYSSEGEIRWWIDPDGKFYDVSDDGHQLWGMKYIKSKATRSIADDFDPYKVLYSLNWTRALFVPPGILYFTYASTKPRETKILDRLKNKARELSARELIDDTSFKKIPFR